MAETLGVVSSIIAIADLSYKVLGYLKAVHDAGKDIQDYNREAPNFAELLTSLAVHVSQHGRQNGDPWFESVRTLQSGPMQQYQTALETFRAKVAPRAGLRKITQRIKWKFVKEEVKDMLDRMERLKSLVVIALQKDHFKLSEAIHGITSSIRDDTAVIRATGEHQTTAIAALRREADKHANTTSQVKDDTTVIRVMGHHHTTDLAEVKREAHKQAALSSAIRQDTSQIGALHTEVRSDKEAEHKAQLLEWLSDHDHIKEQHDNISRYKDGTGMWLLNHSKFKEWRGGAFDTLFCAGMPGAGKTVMSAMVVRHLFQTARIFSDQIAVAFLYLRYDLRDTQSLDQLLRSLMKQLVSQLEKAPDSIEHGFKQFSQGKCAQPSDDMLQAAVDCFNCVYFVIDALDECGIILTRGLIPKIRSLKNAQIKLFATSRHIPEIQAAIAKHPHHSIEIRGSVADIQCYTTDRLSELPPCVQNSRNLQAEIAQAIVTSTQGMFLLAKLQIDSLKDKRTLKAMRSALRALPSGSSAYDTAYDLAIKRIKDQSEDDYQLARKVLTWLVYAMRPISGVDLETALAVELGETHLDPENVVPTAELLSLCAGLVTLDESSKTIRLAHYTTQEYFSRNPQHLLQDPSRALANICVSYLGIDDFMAEDYSEHADRPHLASHIHRYPFLAYAALHWEDHAMATLPPINDDEATQTLALELRLLRNHGLMESYLRARGEWVRNFHLGDGKYKLNFRFERKTGIQYAAARGNLNQVSALLKLGFDKNEPTNDTTPLIEASRGHHESVVRLLVEAKANIHFQTDDSKHTALTATIGMEGMIMDHCASKERQKYHRPTRACESVVALLLNAGADFEHVTGDTENLTPLMHASQYGMDNVVAALCRAGADVNRRGGNDIWSTGGRTALHFAAAHGHENIVKQLLRYNCGSDTTDNTKTTPAVCAAEGQHWKLLELLLDTATIDLDRKTEYGDTILELACRSKDCPDALIKRLLSTSPDSVTASGRSLIRAAEAKRVAVVKMLLEAGTEFYLIDRNRDMALHAIARLDRQDPEHLSIAITQALLGAGVDIDTRGANGVTALMLASRAGHKALVTFLLGKGANVLLRDEGGWGPLAYATAGGQEDIARGLLHAGAAPHAGHSFAYAAASGHIKVLRYLTSAGIDVDTPAERGTTALMSAARSGRLDMAEWLIEAGAAVNARRADGMSPLMFAATMGHRDLMKLFLHSGADASVTNERGETALIGVLRIAIVVARRGICALPTPRRHGRLPAGGGLIDSLSEGIQDVLPMMLKAGVDVNTSTDSGHTALLLATDPNYPSPDDVRLLLEAGADPSVSKQTKQTALISWERIEKMDILVLKSLLKAGADPNQHDVGGMTTLMRLSPRRTQLEKLKLLLEFGARPNAVNIDGQTALMFAVHQANGDLCPEIVRELLSAGANPNHEDLEGQSVLFQLVSREYCSGTSICEETFTLLLAGGGDVSAIGSDQDTLLMRSLRRSGMVSPLLTAGADPQGSDKSGRNTIMLASMISSHDGAEAVTSLLDAGVDPNQRDHNGYNALMLAARYSLSPMTLKTLLRSGMDPHERDAKGRTILMLVLLDQRTSNSHMKPDKRSEMLCVLIEAGVGVNLRDKNGNTALMYAAEHNGPVGPLLKAGADPNLLNDSGRTALMKCFLKKDRGVQFRKRMSARRDAKIEVIKMETGRNALRDAETLEVESGRDVLTWASTVHRSYQNVEVVEQIVKVPNISLDRANNDGDTALMRPQNIGNIGSQF